MSYSYSACCLILNGANMKLDLAKFKPNLNVWWRHATLFDFLCFFCTWFRNRHNTLLLHGCCRLEATWSRIEAGLQGERCRSNCSVLRSNSVEELPSVPNRTWTYAPTSEALTAQNLNVRQRKWGTIIIQTVCILKHDCAVTGSLPDREFLHGQPNVLPMNLAWQ